MSNFHPNSFYTKKGGRKMLQSKRFISKSFRSSLPGLIICLIAVVSHVPIHSETVGDYAGPYSIDGSMITIPCTGDQRVRVKVCTPGILRIDYDPAGLFDPVEPRRTVDAFWNTYKKSRDVPNDLLCAEFNKKEWVPATFSHEETSEQLVVETDLLRIDIQKSPLRISYYRKDNDELLTRNTNDSAMGTGGLRLERSSDEHFFGWGNEHDCLRADYAYDYETDDYNEAFLDKTGRVCGATTAPIIYSTAGYAVFMLNNNEMRHCGGVCDISNPGYVHFSSNVFGWGGNPDRGYLSYYFIYGPSYRELLDRYTSLTGRPQIINKKYLGIQKVWWECTNCWDETKADKYMEWISNHRKNGYHLDVAMMDIMANWGAAKHPDPDTKVPGYSRLLQHCRDRNVVFGGQIQGYGITGYGGFSDSLETSAEINVAVDHGFDVAWYDAMDILSHNHAQTIHDAWRTVHADDISKVFVRYGWGVLVGHALPYGHPGDYLSPRPSEETGGCWRVFPAYLEKCLTAYNVVGTDLGGGAWNVVGTALRPVISFHRVGSAGCGNHGSGWGNEKFNHILNPWEGSADYRTILNKFHNLHYRFIPYLFTYTSQASITGFPPGRHMLMQDFENPQTWDREFQSYVGDWLIQAPYYHDGPHCHGNGIRDNIWLPEGTWYDWWDGTVYHGPKTVDGYNANPGGAADVRLPLFVKSGAIVPLMPEMSYIGEKPEDPLTLAIWPDGTTEFELWEDETGVTSTFTCRATETQASIGIPPFGGSRYSPAERRYMLEVHVPRKPKKVVRNGVDQLAEVSSREALESEPEGWFYESGRGGVCHVKPTTDASGGCNVIVSYDGTVQGIVQNKRLTPGSGITVSHRHKALLVDVRGNWRGRIAVSDIMGRTIHTERIVEPGKRLIPVGHDANGVLLVKLTSHGTCRVEKRITMY